MVATPDPVLIDVDAGESVRTTSVVYNTDFAGAQAFLWERQNGGGWTRIPPDRIEHPTGDPDEQGVVVRQLSVGDVYQVLLYHDEDVDPNSGIGDPDPDLRATVVGLRKGPESRDLITSEEFGPTGTAFVWSPQTAGPTFAVLQVGKEPPETDADGIQRLPRPIWTVTSDGFHDSHSLEISSTRLLPGNPFHALLRITDPQGNWQFRHEPFVTKRRRVTVRLEDIHIINDGAPGNNTASFRIWVLTGARLRSRCDIPERDISDSPDPGHESLEFIQLGNLCQSPVVVLGPEVVTHPRTDNLGNDTLAILTRGSASVTVGEDDISGNFLPHSATGPHEPDQFFGTVFHDAFFRFPIGSANERVENRRFAVRAEPLTDHEFEYDVRVRISVDYH